MDFNALESLLRGVVVGDVDRDKVEWICDNFGVFTVASCYDFYASFRTPIGPPNRYDISLENIWKMEVPFKIKTLGWRLFVNSLPTKDLLKIRELEGRDQSFFKCNIVKIIWKEIALWVDKSYVSEEECLSSFGDCYYIREILIERAYGNRASTCDGIVCFKIDNSSAVLCNPFIRKFKILPPLKYPSGEIFYTLVHDRFINNYKIIAVNCTRSSKIEVNVHILGTNHWRRIRDFPDPNLILVSRLGTFVNDSLNWLVYSAAPFIVSLDLEKESYEKLALPVSYQKLALPVFPNISSFMTLGTLKGCLSLIFDKRDKSCDVWIMKEYGNEKSWTKLLTVPHMKECDFYCYIRALYISEDEKVLMECKKMGINSLVVYDSINNTFMIPEFQNYISTEMTPEVYVESLISPL
ncbi:F-box/kelch-repeat protein At3g23880-like [Vicia villosa]|uniref:F-box/kelch-repeat protein At3g23880-like n=1 Tax=Vicia villosa TaxID=3911 RepID=UPI00273BCBB6|nr:F-box/kelch-repeat protein At3g23880-like [Vicia villosa]